jgi:nucleoside-diphosphate-sugar epimerase
MILVTGGTGVMGSVLVRELARQGKCVRVVCMPGDPYVARVMDCTADIRFADISRAEELQGVCEGIDTVYHLAAVIISRDEAVFQAINVGGTRTVVAQAVEAGVRHFIYVSSASVTYPHPTPYSLSKRAAEEIVRNSELNYTIIRPTLVYGERGGLEFDRYLAYLRRFAIVPFIGNGKALKRPVFVEDVTAGLLALCDTPAAYGKTYNLSGGEAISMIDFTRLCLRCMHLERRPIVHLPVWFCRSVAAIMRLTMKDPPLTWQVIAGIIQDANLDPAEAMTDLGYAPVKVSQKLAAMFPRG